MAENNENTAAEPGRIDLGGGKFFRVKRNIAIGDIEDADGNMFEKDGFVQSPDSIVELTGEDLAGLVLPAQAVADHIYGNTTEE